MAFALHFPNVISCLLKSVIIYYLFPRLHETRSYSLKEPEAVHSETKFDFLYSSWKYLI